MRIGFILDDLISDTSSLLKSDVYPFSKYGIEKFGSMLKPSVIVRAKPFVEAIDVINLLRKRGYLINIFCDRPRNLFTVTSAWLKRFDIRFDSLVFTMDKATVARDMKITSFVDVDFNSLIDFTNYDRMVFSKLVLFEKSYNMEKNHPRFIRAKSWNDIRKVLTRRSYA